MKLNIQTAKVSCREDKNYVHITSNCYSVFCRTVCNYLDCPTMNSISLLLG